jgi:hypothetical protein
LGNGTNPLARSERLTILDLRLGRTLASASWKIDPAYALSANVFARKGNWPNNVASKPDAAVAILNASGKNDGVQQQILHVDENMPFLRLINLPVPGGDYQGQVGFPGPSGRAGPRGHSAIT